MLGCLRFLKCLFCIQVTTTFVAGLVIMGLAFYMIVVTAWLKLDFMPALITNLVYNI
jgi:heme O synthase-like polyprenyltransferase